MTNKRSDEVRDHFARQWKEYDTKIFQAIPFYKESFDILIAVIQQTGIRPERILEIGVGTGNLTRRLLEGFPNAFLLGIDLVEDFLHRAERKLISFNDRTTLVATDINDFEFKETYDLVVTSYVFHHIDNDTQNAIYEKIFTHLNCGGVFVNADFVDSSSRYFSALFDQLRMQYMRHQGVDEDTVKTDYIEHRKTEQPMPLESQMQFLSQIGFREVECFWKYLNLAVFGGLKTDR